MDVDDIHMSKYKPTTMHIEEEQNPAQEVEQPEEDTERIEYDASKGTEIQQEEQITDSTQQGLE